MKIDKRIIFGLAVIVVLIIGVIDFSPKTKRPAIVPQATEQPESETQVVSTVPVNLNHSTILPTQSIEITFNKPLLDSTHLRYGLSPQTPHHIEISSDGKTLRVIPSPQFNLGQDYSLTINSDTKMQDGTNLGKDFSFYFTTIIYSGV